jgi:hypothetical protein
MNRFALQPSLKIIALLKKIALRHQTKAYKTKQQEHYFT